MKDFSGWKYYNDISTQQPIGIVSPDGCESRLLTDPEVAAWLASGGVPLPCA